MFVTRVENVEGDQVGVDKLNMESSYVIVAKSETKRVKSVVPRDNIVAKSETKRVKSVVPRDNIVAKSEVKPLVTNIVYQSYDVSRGKRYVAYEVRESDKSTVELSIQRWAEIMSNDIGGEEANRLSSILNSVSYEAFFFETKGCSSLNAASKQFEFVLIDSPALFQFADSNPDPGAFSEHFKSCAPNTHDICSFKNLGGDALLVSPKPRARIDYSVYSHLGAFVRGAPSDQIRYIWKKVALEYLKLFKDNPQKTFWLSTCGTGVSWLHFRLDTVPKYYSYNPFAMET